MTSPEIARELSVASTALLALDQVLRDCERGDRGVLENLELATSVHECITALETASRAFRDAAVTSRGLDETLEPTRVRLTHIATDLDQFAARLTNLHFAVDFFATAPPDAWRVGKAFVAAGPGILAAVAFARGDLAILQRRLKALSAYYEAAEWGMADETDPAEVALTDALAHFDAERPGDVVYMAGAESSAPSGRTFAMPTTERARYTVVPVMFATDRPKVSGSPTLHVEYGDRFDKTRPLSYGVAEVSIPLEKHHQTGRLERPTLWKLQFRENPERHVVVVTCEEKDMSAWTALASERMADAGQRAALVFIHGYNVSFDEAIRRVGQVGLDLQFRGLITAFSWCSEAKLRSYLTDERNARLAGPKLLEFFHALQAAGVDTIHVIAHSMGNLTLVKALCALPPVPADHPALNEVVFAAPDCDAVDFEEALKEFKGKAKRYTLYGSENDRALFWSKKTRSDYPRAGDGGPNLLVLDGVETIDASATGADLLGLGHSYFGSKRTVLSDLFYVIQESLPPLRRSGIAERHSSGLKYWVFVP